MLFKFQPRRIS